MIYKYLSIKDRAKWKKWSENEFNWDIYKTSMKEEIWDILDGKITELWNYQRELLIKHNINDTIKINNKTIFEHIIFSPLICFYDLEIKKIN